MRACSGGSSWGRTTDTFNLGKNTITMFRLPGYVGGEPEQPVSREVVVATMARASADLAPHWSVDFWVDDVDETARKAGELAGRVVVPPFSAPVGRTAVLADPHGAAFSVSKVSARR